ncbi:hypothetical protein PIB30_103373, partial [Stylosanthes scabra]|nr:hypothetical protein [Stylosanthes scabra]
IAWSFNPRGIDTPLHCGILLDTIRYTCRDLGLRNPSINRVGVGVGACLDGQGSGKERCSPRWRARMGKGGFTSHVGTALEEGKVRKSWSRFWRLGLVGLASVGAATVG